MKECWREGQIAVEDVLLIKLPGILNRQLKRNSMNNCGMNSGMHDL